MLILGLCGLWYAVGGTSRAPAVPVTDGVAQPHTTEFHLGEHPIGWLHEREDGLTLAITGYEEGQLTIFAKGPIKRWNSACDPADLITLTPDQTCRFKIRYKNMYLWWYNRGVGGKDNVVLVIGRG